jgi:hypothetical protein
MTGTLEHPLVWEKSFPERMQVQRVKLKLDFFALG